MDQVCLGLNPSDFRTTAKATFLSLTISPPFPFFSRDHCCKNSLWQYDVPLALEDTRLVSSCLEQRVVQSSFQYSKEQQDIEPILKLRKRNNFSCVFKTEIMVQMVVILSLQVSSETQTLHWNSLLHKMHSTRMSGQYKVLPLDTDFPSTEGGSQDPYKLFYCQLKCLCKLWSALELSWTLLLLKFTSA